MAWVTAWVLGEGTAVIPWFILENSWDNTGNHPGQAQKHSTALSSISGEYPEAEVAPTFQWPTSVSSAGHNLGLSIYWGTKILKKITASYRLGPVRQSPQCPRSYMGQQIIRRWVTLLETQSLYKRSKELKRLRVHIFWVLFREWHQLKQLSKEFLNYVLT